MIEDRHPTEPWWSYFYRIISRNKEYMSRTQKLRNGRLPIGQRSGTARLRITEEETCGGCGRTVRVGEWMEKDLVHVCDICCSRWDREGIGMGSHFRPEG